MLALLLDNCNNAEQIAIRDCIDSLLQNSADTIENPNNRANAIELIYAAGNTPVSDDDDENAPMNIAHPSSVSDRSQVPNLLISDAIGMMLR